MICMNIIYLDTLFFVNFICDYILLLCTARVGGTPLRRIPIALAAALGGIYACLCSLPLCPWLRSPILHAACSVLLCLISFGHSHHLLRCTVIFLCVSAMVGGLLSAVSLDLNGMTVLPIDLKLTLFLFALVYSALSLFFRSLPAFRSRQYHTVTVTYNDQTVRFTALRDTGNELYDPITNLPVMLCEPKLLQPLFPETPLSHTDPYETFFLLSEAHPTAHRIRLIPYRTISNNGVLPAFRPDSVLVDGREEQYIIAFSPTAFHSAEPYHAII